MRGQSRQEGVTQWWGGVFAVEADRLPDLLPAVFAQLGFGDFQLHPAVRLATATLNRPSTGVLRYTDKRQLKIRWELAGAGRTRIEWAALDLAGAQPFPDPDLARSVQQVLETVIERAGPAEPQAAELVLAPGERFKAAFPGNLRDYSACATQADVEDLTSGDLPLGRWAFQKPGRPPVYGQPLFLGRYRTGKPMIYNGVLVCAPQNTGKTSLIVRWAKAANRARYNVFLVDVKGNLHSKLTSGDEALDGDVFYLSTDPDVAGCDRVNFLDGLVSGNGPTAAASERIEQLAAAILPRDSQVRRGSDEEFHYRNSLIWLTGLLHLVLLRQVYLPGSFGRAGRPSLADLYELATDERALYGWIRRLRGAEAAGRRRERAVDSWVRELALLIDPDEMPEGQRDRRYSYRQLTLSIAQALRPFSRSGTMAAKIAAVGPGRLFRLADLDRGEPHPPVTMILAAREQDGDKAELVLGMTIARLQQLLFDRVRLDEPRPILLLLDETRRIRGFEPNKYITYAREAKAGCVIVYQALDQIGDERAIFEILENVGTQIYLGSVAGNTAKYLIQVLPKRSRPAVQLSQSETDKGRTRTTVVSRESAELLTTNELNRLSAGEYPALVYINDQPRRRPILVEMSERAVLQEAAPARRPGR